MKVSACMMVKNEEANMPRVLESLQNVVDEIICVDTGSTDKTVEIAQLYGAKIYHHPWQNNFSLHRNQSIGYATGDWVLIIDADEKIELTPNYKKQEFIAWLTDITEQGYKAVAVQIADYQGGKCAMTCNSARMFKKGTIRYENMVHNQPRFEGACVLNHFFCMHHFGYDLTPEQMKRKFFRTKGLLFKEKKENPNNYDVYFYLCQLYGHHNHAEKSRYWGEKYLEAYDKIPEGRFNQTIYFTMVRNYQDARMYDKAEALLKEALRERPNDPDLASAMSDHGALVRNNKLMAEGARRFITGFKMVSENPAMKGGQFYFSLNDEVLTLNMYRLCVASLEEGMRCWQAIKPKISTMSPTLQEELKVNMKIVGLPQLLEESQLGAAPQTAMLDVRDVRL